MPLPRRNSRRFSRSDRGSRAPWVIPIKRHDFQIVTVDHARIMRERARYCAFLSANEIHPRNIHISYIFTQPVSANATVYDTSCHWRDERSDRLFFAIDFSEKSPPDRAKHALIPDSFQCIPSVMNWIFNWRFLCNQILFQVFLQSREIALLQGYCTYTERMLQLVIFFI